MLDGGIDRHVPLVLVERSGGSGKSTLLASWASRQAIRVAWLQVEDGDSDPARFWSSLVEAIGRQRPNVGPACRRWSIGSQGDGRVIVPALVNELINDEPGLVVVIDDYHLIDSDSVHRGVERLIDLCPPELTVVLVDAGRPTVPPRSAARAESTQRDPCRGSALRHASEASVLLGAATASLSATMLDELCTRTEGWAAGLVLAGLSLERAADPAQFVEAFRGDNQLVVSYLSDELLAATPRRRPAATPRDVGARSTHRIARRCGHRVVGREASGSTTTADQNQLVVRLDSTGEWFRYHHLLRDLLAARSTAHVSGTDPRAPTPRRGLVRIATRPRARGRTSARRGRHRRGDGARCASSARICSGADRCARCAPCSIGSDRRGRPTRCVRCCGAGATTSPVDTSRPRNRSTPLSPSRPTPSTA